MIDRLVPDRTHKQDSRLEEAALRWCSFQLMSYDCAAPAAGLKNAEEELLNAAKERWGVDHHRWHEFGHISYCQSRYMGLAK